MSVASVVRAWAELELLQPTLRHIGCGSSPPKNMRLTWGKWENSANISDFVEAVSTRTS